MENLILKCSKCGKPVKVPPEMATQPIQCPHCDTRIAVPTKQDAPSASQQNDTHFAPIVHGHPLASYGMIVSIIACVASIAAIVLVNSLQTKLSLQKLDIDLQKQKMTDLSRKLLELDSKGMAILDPAQKGWSVSQTEGIFYIQLTDVTPYLDGLKVKLTIGNPMVCTYEGLSLYVMYGPRMDNYYRYLEKNLSSMKLAPQIKIPNILKPGQSTNVEIIVPSIKPTEFGRLEVGVSPEKILLI